MQHCEPGAIMLERRRFNGDRGSAANMGIELRRTCNSGLIWCIGGVIEVLALVI